MTTPEPTDEELIAALAALTGAEPETGTVEGVGGAEDTAQGLLERGRGT